MGIRAFVLAAAAGAGLMYFFDPERGKRRRALVRDQLEHARRSSTDPGPARDLANRARGTVAELRYRFDGKNVDDAVLVERVRSKIGRAVRYASSIEADAQDGRITLRGPVLRKDLERLHKAVESVPGVRNVDDQQLDVYEQPGNIPGLQGDTSAPPTDGEMPPSFRALVGIGGGLLALFGLLRGGIVGTAMVVAGVGLAARGITNLSFERLTGFGAGRRAVDFHKTINVNVPIDRVFSLWANYENFPRFMSNVREVTDRGLNRSHWVVGGPLGVPVEWDAVITRFEQNEALAWKTVEGSPIEHAGIVRFQPNEEGGTRVDIRLSYNPIFGAAAHAVAALFHSDPKAQMDEDLMRMKSFVETGQAPHDTQERELVGARASTRRSEEERRAGQDVEEGPTARDIRDRAAEEEMTAFTGNPDSIPSD
jgi:uncharacterized membrane protein